MDEPRAEALLAAMVLVGIFTTFRVSFSAFRRKRIDSSGVSGSPLLSSAIRAWYFDNLRPFEDWLVARKVSPTTVTFSQVICSIAIAICYAGGWLFLAGWLVLAVGSLDILDGRVARRAGKVTARGAFLDSVFDRYADSLAYIGLAIYFRASWVLLLVLLVLLGASMVSYSRARAEALSVECRLGLGQRPERIVLLGFGTLFGVLIDRLAGPWMHLPDDFLLVVILGVLAALTNVSAVQRILHVEKQLEERADV